MAENLAMQTTEERTDTLIKLVYDESSTCSKVILFFSYSWVYTLFFVDYSSLATNRYLPPLQFYQYYAFALTVGLYTFCVYSHSRWAVFFTVFFGLISFATLFFYIFATYTSGYFGDNYVNLYDGITCYPGYTNDSSNCDWGTQWNASYIGEGTYSSSLMVGTITVVSISSVAILYFIIASLNTCKENPDKEFDEIDWSFSKQHTLRLVLFIFVIPCILLVCVLIFGTFFLVQVGAVPIDGLQNKATWIIAWLPVLLYPAEQRTKLKRDPDTVVDAVDTQVSKDSMHFWFMVSSLVTGYIFYIAAFAYDCGWGADQRVIFEGKPTRLTCAAIANWQVYESVIRNGQPLYFAGGNQMVAFQNMTNSQPVTSAHLSVVFSSISHFLDVYILVLGFVLLVVGAVWGHEVCTKEQPEKKIPEEKSPLKDDRPKITGLRFLSRFKRKCTGGTTYDLLDKETRERSQYNPKVIID